MFLEYYRGPEQLPSSAQSSRLALGHFFFLPVHRRSEQRGDFTSQVWKPHISYLTSQQERQDMYHYRAYGYVMTERKG